MPLLPISEIAARLGVPAADIEPYGHYKAKLPLSLIKPEAERRGQVILVTAISPTPAGEGKTTMSLGISMALNRLGHKAVAVLREPSLGPVFGMKGGATGGGAVQMEPSADINLHFTGDFNAVEKAHNLLAALVDNELHFRALGLGLDPRTVVWKRVMDMNDRALRNINIGLGGTLGGVPRESGFDITAASEVMAILCLSSSLADLEARLGSIYIGQTYDKQPIFARQLQAVPAMMVLLKDAVRPNLVQTSENTPVLVHGGPFANIAQGTNTLFATWMGQSLADYVVTEAGFGADLGAEKFLDIKCRAGGIHPPVAVVVATVRALKFQGGVALKDLATEDIAAVARGFVNLARHIENLRKFGLRVVVCVNAFPTDTAAEHDHIVALCAGLDAPAAVSTAFAHGGAGSEAVAQLVVQAAQANAAARLQPLYDMALSTKDKVATIAREIYRADGVRYEPKAEADLKRIDAMVASGAIAPPAICMAKTQYSFSDNPTLLGAPTGFVLNVRAVELAAGAGFAVPLTGELVRMPGLPKVPASATMRLLPDGSVEF